MGTNVTDVDATQDDPESADAGALDLTPRDDVGVAVGGKGSKAGGRSGGGSRSMISILAAVVIVGAIGALLATQLAGAATYFYNVDQAVAKKAEIGSKRIRIQGNVIKGSEVGRTKDSVQGYTIAYNGVEIPVEQTGDVPDLFGPSIPVVIEGHFAGSTFKSDRVLVKHDETYDEANSKRVKEAKQDAEKNASSTTVPTP